MTASWYGVSSFAVVDDSNMFYVVALLEEYDSSALSSVGNFMLQCDSYDVFCRWISQVTCFPTDLWLLVTA